VKLTAGTITDEQIRELRSSVNPLGTAYIMCHIALGERLPSKTVYGDPLNWNFDPLAPSVRARARAEAAKIINARSQVKRIAEVKVTADTITDEQIRELRDRIARDPAWGGGNGTRDRMIKSCDRALQSRLYRGALAFIADALNAEATEMVAERAIACPRCDVAPGIRCTSMNHTGYKALRQSHAERIAAFGAREKGNP